jgi:hypothetical protein
MKEAGMVLQKTGNWRRLVLGILALAVVLLMAEQASAFPAGPHGVGPHRVFVSHPHVHTFFGLGFYGYPFGFYYPWYYDYYAPYYYPYQPYGPGEHQFFPDFKLPGFFQYPGAVGKGEDEPQAFQDYTPAEAPKTGPETTPPGRAGQ